MKIPLILAAAVLLASCSDTKTDAFDSEAWIYATCDNSASETTSSPTRYQMIDALEDELKVGMSKDDVAALLGPSEATAFGDGTFIYCLGRGLIDYEEYWVVFDGDDKIESFRKVQG